MKLLKLFLSVATSLALIVPASLSASAYQTNGLMFYFDFSNLGATTNGSSLTDLSGNGRNGTIRGTGITSDSANKAIKFPGGNTGTNYVELAGSFADFTNGVSIEFEGNFGTTLSDWERIFDFGSSFSNNSTDNQFWVGHMYNSGELALETWINGVNQGRCHTTTGGTALDTTETFAKWLITVDSTNGCRIYKNGVEQNTQVKNALYTNDTPVAANGSAYPLPNNYTRTANFLGRSNWTGDRDFEGSIRYIRMYNTALTPTQAQENAVTTYAVTYDEQGGSSVPDGTFSQGGSLTYPTNPTKNGYTFQGWFDASSGGNLKTASAVAAANASTTLYAQWSANTYNVTYDEHGGSTVSDASYVYGNTLSFPTAPTKTGHTFLGWFDAASGGSSLTAATIYGRSTDSALHAQWNPNTYNVTYDEHGGSTVSDGSYVYGNTLSFPTAPTKTGHTFLGWFDAASGGSELSASTVSARVTNSALHAQWNPNTYNVTYEEHGGSTVSDGSYVYGNTLVFPTAPTRSGYTFAGWFAAASGGSALTASAVSAGTSNVTLHAQWTPLPSQTVTWAPTNTSVLRNLSSVTPSSTAATNGDGQISYSVFDARTTGCSVDSSTGVVTFTGVGTCSVRATAASTANYLADTHDVDFTITSSTPAVSLALDLTTGSTVANSTVDYAASGLRSNSAWTLIVRSNPQTIASGTYSSSLLSGTAQIPSGLSAGWHSITLTGIGANGETISHAVWFEVSNSGTLLQTSGTGPVTPTSSVASLAQTGANTNSLWMGAVLLLTGAAFILLRRSTASKK